MNLIYFIRLNKEPLAQEYELFERVLGKNSISVYSNNELKNRSSLVGKLAVIFTACQNLSVKNSELFFCCEENGKPYLKSYPDFHFNISHSGSFVAVAFSDSPIGIDIEELRNTDFKIAKRFFSENEIKYINNNSRRFFEIWTKKEAYLKQSGTGLKFPLSAFDVTENEIASNFECFEKNGCLISVYSQASKVYRLFNYSEAEFLEKCIIREGVLDVRSSNMD